MKYTKNIINGSLNRSLSDTKKEVTFKTGRNKKKYILFIIVIFLLLAGMVGAAIKTSSLQLVVTEYEYVSEKINEPVTVAVLADLHDTEFGSKNEEFIAKVKELKPDLILLAGDMINEDTEDFEPLILLCSEFQKIAPTCISKGNQERDNPLYETLKNRFEKEEILFLDKSYADMKIRDNRIRIGGLYSYTFAPSADNEVVESQMSESSVSFLKEFESTDDLKLLMTHRPDSFLFSKTPDYWEVDLAVCGHFHGGQIVIPGLGGLWAPHMGFFPEYVKGEKILGNLTMFTTSGLGSGSKLVPRLNNPPEIMLIRMKSS